MKKNKDELPALSPKEKLEAENELLKLKLQAEFGMAKMESSLEGGAENEWLNYIYNFEKQYAEGKRCKLYDFIGRPEFLKVEELPKSEIEPELERLNRVMLSNGIEFNVLYDYNPEIIYRFITEELFERETDDIRIPGMMSCFIYEEFYPNHYYDIIDHSYEFVNNLMGAKWDDYIDIVLASIVRYNDVDHEQTKFRDIINAFQNENKKLKLLSWKVNSVEFDLGTREAMLKAFIKYRSSKPSQAFEGNIELGLTLQFDYWCISKVDIPGFSK